MENPSNIASLFNRYLENRCSEEEAEYLLSLLTREEYKEYAAELILRQTSRQTELHPTDDAVKERLEQRLKYILEKPETKTAIVSKPLFRKMSFWRAAAAILIVASTTYFFINRRDVVRPSSLTATSIRPASAAPYIRYIKLPDGSAVVLHGGSKLQYPDNFSGSVREVTLTGEAYFDIASDPRKPFIIHTGNVRTTVLGTAFNIKADSSKVVVSVTRGKVKVEDASKVLAVLTPDQQVEYNVPAGSAEQQTVNASTLVTDWTKQDMVFNGITFSEIAEILSKRYGVPVLFRNEALKDCKIMASFSGTEALGQVASVLSGIRNGSYEIDRSGTLWLDGESCE